MVKYASRDEHDGEDAYKNVSGSYDPISNSSQRTTFAPRFSSLLNLQKHVAASVIIGK
jgi:hypothetical protein